MAVAIPFIAMAASAGGSAIAGADRADALNANAATMAYEGRTAAAQGYQAEAEQRRRAGMVLGQEAAAAGQAGAGYGGSVGRSMKQSALNAELDALNVRYKTRLQKWSFDTQATNLRAEASAASASGTLNTASALLRGYSQNYMSPNLG